MKLRVKLRLRKAVAVKCSAAGRTRGRDRNRRVCVRRGWSKKVAHGGQACCRGSLDELQGLSAAVMTGTGVLQELTAGADWTSCRGSLRLSRQGTGVLQGLAAAAQVL